MRTHADAEIAYVPSHPRANVRKRYYCVRICPHRPNAAENKAGNADVPFFSSCPHLSASVRILAGGEQNSDRPNTETRPNLPVALSRTRARVFRYHTPGYRAA